MSTAAAKIVALAGCFVVACSGAVEAPGVAPGALPRLVPVATFGCAECDGPELLAQPGVTVGTRGRIYVTDTREPLVRVLEPDGTLAVTFGRPGEGPGEFRLPLLLGILEDTAGGMWVQEAMFLHHFDAAGLPIESRPYAGRVPLGWAYDHERGEIYVLGFSVGPGSVDRRRALLRYTTDGGDGEEVAPWDSLVGGPDGQRPDPDARWSTLAVAPAGELALVDVEGYRVRILSPEGAPLHEFGRSELPRPVKFEARLERERRLALERGDPPPDPLGPHLAGAAAFDHAGRLWLPTLREPGLIDVFSPDGAFLGEVSVGARIVESALGFRIGGQIVAAVLLDDLELPRVGIWRIVEE